MSAKQKTVRIGGSGLIRAADTPYLMRQVGAALGIPRHRASRIRVTVSPRGRYSLRASQNAWSEGTYAVYDHEAHAFLNFGSGWLCAPQLRSVLRPLPVRLGQRYNIKVLPA